MSTDITDHNHSDSTAESQIQLDIGGMTCASCAARIEKKLNRMEGVTASVNYTTEKAKVTFADNITAADLIAQIEATGYTAHVPTPKLSISSTGEAIDSTAGDDPTRMLRQRLTISAVLAPPTRALVSTK